MSNHRLEFEKEISTSIVVDSDIQEEIVSAMQEDGWECVAVDGEPLENPVHILLEDRADTRGYPSNGDFIRLNAQDVGLILYGLYMALAQEESMSGMDPDAWPELGEFVQGFDDEMTRSEEVSKAISGLCNRLEGSEDGDS